ncbi:hypothetical protein EDC53_104212 [Phytobacter diazotrophicus]|nr:hypothetical protein EDC53_104212 [Phytobacter diazotrophicus]
MYNINHISDVINKNPEIAIFRFFKFTFENNVQTRLGVMSEAEKRVINKTISHKNETKTSFWESFFRVSLEEGEINNRLLNESLFHNENGNYIYVKTKDVSNFLLNPPAENIAINSAVIMKNGEIKHIPLLDFKIPYKDKNTEIVKEVLLSLGAKGHIINSGKSYHFYGTSLFKKEELMKFLAYFILFHPISDKSWSVHQLLEESASLRITSKNGQPPLYLTYC